MSAASSSRPACVMHERNGGHHEPCVHCQLAESRAEANRYRIEADCALRDFDGLELDAGIMREALEKIAAKRPNHSFDPWAVEVASAALGQTKEGSDRGNV